MIHIMADQSLGNQERVLASQTKILCQDRQYSFTSKKIGWAANGL